MHIRNKAYHAAVIGIVITIGLLLFSPTAQNRTKKKPVDSSDLKGVPVLWQPPHDIASRNLFLGRGGSQMAPDLSRVTYVEDKKTGTFTKYRVRDAAGRVWIAKLGEESQPEAAADRLMWAMGYGTDITYLVPRLNIEGKGVFNNVLLKARPKGVKRLGEWEWEHNPFNETMEFQGLKVMMALVNNWDLKNENNKILRMKDPDTGTETLHYIISDLGATFGKSGGLPFFWRITRSRNKPEDYARSRFIEKVKGDRVYFAFHNKNSKMFDNITVAQAKWIGDKLAQLSPQQISDAFRAANYSDRQVQIMTNAVLRRIGQLVDLPSNAASLPSPRGSGYSPAETAPHPSERY